MGMKMRRKKTFQKLAAVILVMAMVFTGVSLDTIKVSAASKKPTKITLNAKSKTLTVGKTFQLKVKSVKPIKASKSVTYKSSKKSVATVSSKGKVVAKKAGSTTITVTSKANKKVKATCKITVKKKVTPIRISTVKELKAIADNPGEKYILVKDIKITDKEWKSLGDFSGEFDGKGHKITNLRSSKGESLFGNLKKKAVVKNLTLEGKISTKNSEAALLAKTSEGKVFNCVTSGSVVQKSGRYPVGVAGILVSNYGYMEKCENRAKVENKNADSTEYNFTAGVAAWNEGNIINCKNVGSVTTKCMYTGGVTGYNAGNSSVKYCYNSGRIIGTSDENGIEQAMGGIIGWNQGIVQRCINEGKISISAKKSPYDIGGIVGTSDGYSEISECENKGNISGIGNIAGICGELCLASGTYDKDDNFIPLPGNVVVKDCKNSGEIRGYCLQNGTYSVAGIVGCGDSMVGKISVKNCLNSGNVIGTGSGYCGGVLGVLMSSKSGEVSVMNLKNEGNIVGEATTGGVFGQIQGNEDKKSQTIVSKCINKGEVSGSSDFSCNGIGAVTFYVTLEQCCNTGKISGLCSYGITDCVGKGSKILYSCNLGTVDGSRWAAGITSCVVDGGYLNQVFNAGEIRGEGIITYFGRSIITNQTISPEEPQIDENLVSCYYLAQDLVNENELGIPIEVSVMEQQESYIGFDFENIWVMKEQGGRRLPYLKNLSE